MSKLIVIKGCNNCPFANHDVDYGMHCNMAEEEIPHDWADENDGDLGNRWEATETPDWCPLKAESITVELKA